jgi:hypothetical protein
VTPGGVVFLQQTGGYVVFQGSPHYKSAVQQELSLLRKLVALRRTASSKAFIAARATRSKLPHGLLPALPPTRTTSTRS